MATDPTPESKPSAANAPPAMTPYAIALALFRRRRTVRMASDRPG